MTEAKLNSIMATLMGFVYAYTGVNKGFAPKSFSFTPHLIFKVKQKSSKFYTKGSWICCC